MGCCCFVVGLGFKGVCLERASFFTGLIERPALTSLSLLAGLWNWRSAISSFPTHQEADFLQRSLKLDSLLNYSVRHWSDAWSKLTLSVVTRKIDPMKNRFFRVVPASFMALLCVLLLSNFVWCDSADVKALLADRLKWKKASEEQINSLQALVRAKLSRGRLLFVADFS